MQINNKKNYGLLGKDYDKIEQMVVNLLYKTVYKNGSGNFPIDPFEIAKYNGYKIKPYSKLDEKAIRLLLNHGISGASIKNDNGEFVIYYDDCDGKQRQRFTIMHEIGHIMLGHKQDSDYAEKCANYFASYSLVPTSMVGLFNCYNLVDISKKFNVSSDCAGIAFERFQRWRNNSRGLKDHEILLNRMFS